MVGATIFCEICGRAIKGKALRVLVDRSEMLLCPSCAKRHGKILGTYAASRRQPQSVVTSPYRTRPYRVRTRPTRRREENYEVVEDYAERIREAREEMGLTREILARMVGEKESTIRRIESGKLTPSIDLAKKLERVLKITLLQPVSEGLEALREEGEEYYLTLGDVVEFKD